jgi:hypothetical protein
MIDPFTLAMIGAGVGALLTPEKPVQGAVTGGLLGYGGGSAAAGALKGGSAGGVGNLINGVGSNALVGGDVAKGAMLNASALSGSGAGVQLAPISSSAPLSYSLAPETVSSGAGINLSGSLVGAQAPYSGFSQGATGELGANMAFNPSRTIGMDISAPAFGKGEIDNVAQMATGSDYELMAKDPSMLDKLRPYANIQNLSGASNIMKNFQPQRMPQAPSGGMQRGQAPQGTDVMALLASIKPREQRRISLL